jgi:hypothetical protein
VPAGRTLQVASSAAGFETAAASVGNTADTYAQGLQQPGAQQLPHNLMGGAAAGAAQQAAAYAVGSKRPLSAVPPADAMNSAVNAAKRVLHSSHRWQAGQH